MKIKDFLSCVCIALVTGISAQECEMPISIQLDEEFTNVPPAASSVLYQSLNRIATENGLTTASSITPFIMTVHCEVLEKSNLTGPPSQTIYNLGLTFYIVDTYQKKKFSTAYIELSGVGTGEVKSYIHAFRQINSKKTEIKNLISSGKERMISYYNSQYTNIFKEVDKLVSLQRYEEALAVIFSVPLCSDGGEKASEYGLQIYTKYLDRMNLFMLNKARSLWAAKQNQQTAYDVCTILSQIDPEAGCYKDSENLMKEVKQHVQSDINFEMREKYNDKLQLERSRIEAAKAVGVAFGNGQKSSAVNLMWLK